jgi:hypothetical protein
VLQTALQNAHRTGEQYLIWRLHAILGRLYHNTNRDAEAENEFAEVRRLIEKLAHNIPENELKEKFRTQANRIIEVS